MENVWRNTLKKYIEDHYIQNREREWLEFFFSTTGALNITVISNQFAGLSLPQRREQIFEILKQHSVPAQPGFISLYTVQEAEVVALSRPSVSPPMDVTSWYDLAVLAANAEESPKEQLRKPCIPHTVTFYSFKGGVGRTTALTHVAAILAMQGRKVVVVDLDLQAPGLGAVFNLKPLTYGIVDYFYERASLPDDEDVEPAISMEDILREIPLQDATGRLFVVPAGTLDLDYIAKVDDLRSTVITSRGGDLWSIFFQDITRQLQPDIILVDSCAGINSWSAFSLLRAADKAITFLYTNEQNRQGIQLLIKSLSDIIPVHFVFSLIPSGEASMEKVYKLWRELEEEQDSSNTGTFTHTDDPVVIPYLTGMAVTDNYPEQTLLSYYMNLANIIDEDITAA